MNIKVDNISFSYKNKQVINDFSLNINQGEIVNILSPSGGGKTTLASLLSLSLFPSEGTIYIDKIDSKSIKGIELRTLKRKITLVPQNPYSSFDPLLSIRKSIEILKPKKNWEDLIPTLFPSHAPSLDVFPSNLSGGEIQRFALLRALALDPEVLILDEITSSLDPLNASKIIQLISLLNKEKNLSIIFFTHDREAIKLLGGRNINL